MTNNILEELTRLYTDKSRHYHNLKHIVAMLMAAPEPLLIEQTIAIWFHDAIYNPVSSTNEEDSAALVRQLYDVDDLERYADIKIIEKIILSTKKHEPLCEQANLVLDLDLSILGSPSHVYSDYVTNIIAEYAPYVPLDMFYAGRAAFLDKFLQRDTLFFTDWGKQTFEQRARINLSAELNSYNKQVR